MNNPNELEIVRIPIWPFSMVNAHFIKGPKGVVLIDTGMPGSEKKIAQTLEANGLDWKDIKLIIITHAHTDHAGSAAAVRELSGAPILAHADDAQHYSGEVPMTYCATGIVGSMFYKTGLPLEKYLPFVPDIMLKNNEEFDLAPYGIPGTVRHTPGHTAGSISAELESKDAMVGDLLASGILLGGIVRLNTPARPPFEDDPRMVAKQLQRLVDAGMVKFHLGHGGPLGKREVQAHIENLQKVPVDFPLRG